MASLVTAQFERYIAEQTVSRGNVVFDEFIFANIPGLTEDNLAQHLKMPTNAQIVHRQAVSQNGVINENAVVYSVTLGTEVGDFDFNFIGLINKSQNLLAVAVQTAPVKKTRNKNAVQGNSITRNILLEFSGAKALTGINVNANTWQIDFTVRLHGIDEKIRYTHRDLYGRAVFFGDSFKVERQNAQHYRILPGTAYVEGVRLAEATEKTMDINHLPCSIYVDVVHHCTVTGAYETEIRYITQNKADYLDTANRQHYVQILADIDRQGNVTDRRLLSPLLGINPLPLTANTQNHADEHGHSHSLPSASLQEKGITSLSNNTNSDSETVAATPKAVKTVKDQVDSVLRNQANYIPNSKKSSAVDSNSEDTVATSVAVKTAYDKGIEAKAAAENAHSAANSAQSTADAAQLTANNGVSKANEANNNANGRVSKSGDTMTGLLSVPKIHLTENRTGESLQFGDDAWMGDVDMDNAVGVKGQQHPEQGYIAFGTAKKRFGYDGGKFLADAPLTVPDISSQGLWIERQHAFIRIKSSAHVSAAIDFTVQNGVHPHAAIETIDVGNYSTDIRFHTTPRGSDYNRDRRHHIVTFAPEGHIWAKPYGWLHDYFSKKADTYEKSRFATRFYSNHYNGAQVFDIPVGERSAMRIIEMNVTSGTYGEFNLPETLSGWAIPTANDVGEGKFPVGISMFDNNNKVKIWTRGNHVGIHVIVIGVVNW